MLSSGADSDIFRFSWLIVQTLNDHSGYHFPIVFSPEMHDFHHLRFVKLSNPYDLIDTKLMSQPVNPCL